MLVVSSVRVPSVEKDVETDIVRNKNNDERIGREKGGKKKKTRVYSEQIETV